MSAFPATFLQLSNYQTFVSLLSTGPGFYSETTSESPLVGFRVDYHHSVKRSKTSPKYLPQSYQLRRISYGLHSSTDIRGYLGGTTTTVSRATSPYWSSPWEYDAQDLISEDLRPSLAEQLLEKVFAQLKQDTANLSVDALEAKQTLKLIRSLLSVRKAAEEFSKAVSRKGPHRPKRKYVIVYDEHGRPTKERRYYDVPGSPGRDSKRAAYIRDKWLEARYGIRPLVSSIFDTMKALLNQRITGNVTIKVRVKGHRKSKQVTGDGTSIFPFGEFDVVYDVRGSAVFSFGLPDSGSQLQNFASLNPAGWVWEALPLSFVADWFWNVGQTLQNWEDWFRYSSSFRGGATTFVEREVRTVSYRGYFSQPIRYYPNGNVVEDIVYERSLRGASQCIYTRKRREVHSALPSPSGVTSRVNLNSAKVVDLCSIISQKLKTVR